MEGLRPTCDDVELPEDLQARVLERLPPNDKALSGRFVSKYASRHLSQHCTARLSLPLPHGMQSSKICRRSCSRP